MTNYTCTWWERTEKMTPFVDGISSPIFRSVETGEELSSRDLPIGALYKAHREADAGPDDFPRVGADGLSIVCVLSGGHHWMIEGRASNCTKPNDHTHRCWIRHGTFGEKLTVDKNGNTCGAGAGSFFMDDNKWHGFLRNGVLVQS